MKHKHHIVPRHVGGSDDPENIVELTVTQHAMYHFANWQLWGRDHDRIAWRAIAGIASSEETVRAALSLGGRRGMATKKARGQSMYGRSPESIRLGGQVGGKIVGERLKAEGRGVCAPGMARKGGLQMKGKKWWTNGSNTVRAHECPGEGWRRGRK